MKKILKNPAQIITVNSNGLNYKRGLMMDELHPLTDYSIYLEDGIIKDFVSNNDISKYKYDEEIDLENKIILPGLIDCHTHTVFAGNRANEFKLKLKGATYEEIAAEGGGINNTVNSVRLSSFDELFKISAERINYFISRGITSLEIKSGYGLSFYDEIKILQVIKALKNTFEIDIVPTFLGAHTFPPEFKNDRQKYIDMIINEMLPYIYENKLAVFCDVFCEKSAFLVDEADLILNSAKNMGFKIKLHTEQFNDIGGISLAFKHNAVSVDHLEVLNEENVIKIANSDITAVLLPGVSFFLNYDYANADKLIKNNGIVAISTDFNPGSSHIQDLNLIMSIAALKMKMTIEETISAVTINAAKAIGIEKITGSIEIGKQADFSIYDTTNYADIVYSVGKNLNVMTIKKGNIIYNSKGIK